MKIYKVSAVYNHKNENTIADLKDLEYITNTLLKTNIGVYDLYKNNIEEYCECLSYYKYQYDSDLIEYLLEEDDGGNTFFIFNKKQIIDFIERYYRPNETYYCGFIVVEHNISNVDFKNFFFEENYSVSPKKITYLLSSGPDNVSDITNKINKLKDFT